MNFVPLQATRIALFSSKGRSNEHIRRLNSRRLNFESKHSENHTRETKIV